MTAPSPTCLVNAASTTDGVNVTASVSFTIALADISGVNTWEISCISTDETNTTAAINATVVINSIAKTATVTAPAVGSAMIFRSRVNSGLDVNGAAQSAYTTTFGVYVLAATGLRVLAFAEELEASATFGWVSTVNSTLRTFGNAIAQQRFITPDANHKLLYVLDDADGASTVVNTGNLGTTYNLGGDGTPYYGRSGFFTNNAANVFGDPINSDVAGAGVGWSATSYHPPFPMTFEAWFIAFSLGGFLNAIAGHRYKDGGGEPFVTYGLSTNATAVKFDITTGSNGSGARTELIASQANRYVQSGVWHHQALTYDGTNFYGYFDGDLVANIGVTGALDYNTAGHNYFYIGDGGLGTGLALDGCVQRVALSNVARSAAYMREQYLRGYSRWNP